MSATANNQTIQPLLPPALQRGDTIGLAPLAGPWQEEPFRQGITILHDFGFQTKVLQHQQCSEPYLAASDQQRADIFLELYKDPEVSAILACRGGYGTMRLLPLLDFYFFKESSPKSIIGFSDISGLLNVITAKTGLITYHGPNLTTLASSTAATLIEFRQLLTGTSQPAIHPRALEIINPGQTSGILAGGNLATLVHLMGTPYELDLTDKILLIEDIGEAPYRLDRLLSQLALAGQLQRCNGIILGQFSNCGDVELLWQRVQELTPATTPIWAGFEVGHEKTNQWLPIGLPVQMDSNQGELQLLGPFHS